jgi:hypothetical protein
MTPTITISNGDIKSFKDVKAIMILTIEICILISVVKVNCTKKKRSMKFNEFLLQTISSRKNTIVYQHV